MFSYGGGEVREIRFRVWDTQMMKMYTNCPNVMLDYRGHPYWQFGFDEPKPMSDSIVMQFTGLKDKNGKEIYEGDVLKLVVYNNIGKHSIRIVSFDKGCFGFIDNTGKFFPLGIIIGNKGNEKIFEVIGNIHSNPELLEATK